MARSNDRRSGSRKKKTASSSAAALKLVNQGSYGCIYRPSLRCGAGPLRAATVAPQRRNGGEYLSKLQASGRAAQTEIDIGAKVAKIPQYAQRFAPVVSSCPVVRAQIPSQEKAFRDCKALFPPKKKGSSGVVDLVLMKMPAAGSLTLAKYLRARWQQQQQNVDEVDNEDEDTAEEDDDADDDATVRFTNRLADVYHVLCDSIALLVSASIVHNDLKDNNVMYHEEKHAPVIIDFGLSLDIAALLRSDDAELWRGAFYAYQPDYGPWGPESVLCSALWQGSAKESRPPGASGGGARPVGLDEDTASTTISTTTTGGARPEKQPQRNSADDVLGTEEIAALAAAMTTCFARHPSIQSVRARRSSDVEAKLQRVLQQVRELQGMTRIEASRQVLQQSWRRWDRFALAGVLLPYRKKTSASSSASSSSSFWNQVDADVLA